MADHNRRARLAIALRPIAVKHREAAERADRYARPSQTGEYKHRHAPDTSEGHDDIPVDSRDWDGAMGRMPVRPPGCLSRV